MKHKTIERGKFNASVLVIWAGKYDIEIIVDTDAIKNLSKGDYLFLCVRDDMEDKTILSPWIKRVEDHNNEEIENPISLWEIVEDHPFFVKSKGVGPDGYILELEPEDIGVENDDIFERLSDFAEEINGL